ncbi:MAG: dethiobiotin synthase [Deltaproteobacteria bacterium]|jgi:dethiobiotin synthetase|nr:dethiobiotin synthase [Deltaproteobacteria bacterium]
MGTIDLPPQIFVAGTGTGVGKTMVSAILAAGLSARYWKPIQSGLVEKTDTEWVREKTGLPSTYFYPETYRLRFPLSPHVAAEKDGIHIDLELMDLPQASGGRLIVEGAGGIMVPLNEHHLMLDLMKKLATPILLVAESGLGTINHTLLSLDLLKNHFLPVLGVVMNGPLNPENRKAIEHFGNTPVCAEIEPMERIDGAALKNAFRRCFGTS